MHDLHKIMPNACIGQGYGQLCSPPSRYSPTLNVTGLTETCTTVAIIPPSQRFGLVGSAGQLLPGIIARVVKPDGSLAKEGEPGELVVTGPSMAMGYMDSEAA